MITTIEVNTTTTFYVKYAAARLLKKSIQSTLAKLTSSTLVA